MKLVLFDIDGTILLTDGRGRRSLELALDSVIGQPVDTSRISFAGKTDRQILREILESAGVDAREAVDTLVRIEQAYQDEMCRMLEPADVRLLPGARQLIETLGTREDVQLALLTGNLERTAYLKLESVGLDGFFPFGAFGSDDEDRNNLPTVALARALAHTGRQFDSDRVFIIGDTEHDVTCSRTIGCRTVIVCTGTYSRQDLAPLAPDLLLDDLSDYLAVTDYICRDLPPRRTAGFA